VDNIEQFVKTKAASLAVAQYENRSKKANDGVLDRSVHCYGPCSLNYDNTCTLCQLHAFFFRFSHRIEVRLARGKRWPVLQSSKRRSAWREAVALGATLQSPSLGNGIFSQCKPSVVQLLACRTIRLGAMGYRQITFLEKGPLSLFVTAYVGCFGHSATHLCRRRLNRRSAPVGRNERRVSTASQLRCG